MPSHARTTIIPPRSDRAPARGLTSLALTEELARTSAITESLMRRPGRRLSISRASPAPRSLLAALVAGRASTRRHLSPGIRLVDLSALFGPAFAAFYAQDRAGLAGDSPWLIEVRTQSTTSTRLAWASHGRNRAGTPARLLVVPRFKMTSVFARRRSKRFSATCLPTTRRSRRLSSSG